MSRDLVIVLAEKVEALERRVQVLELSRSSGDGGPRLPAFPTAPQPDDQPVWPQPVSFCPKCGIRLERVMSYSCPVFGCPTGLGPLVVSGSPL